MEVEELIRLYATEELHSYIEEPKMRLLNSLWNKVQTAFSSEVSAQERYAYGETMSMLAGM